MNKDNLSKEEKYFLDKIGKLILNKKSEREELKNQGWPTGYTNGFIDSLIYINDEILTFFNKRPK